jgi:uncharacterized protein Smg (DUF494 family)
MNHQKQSLDKIMKIMQMLARRMEKKGVSHPVQLPSPDDLVKKGYHFDDIESALRWLSLISEEIDQNAITNLPEQATAEKSGTGHRLLHTFESVRLTAEARDFLLSLINEGRITPLHFEKTIEYLWTNDLRDVSMMRIQMVLDLCNPFPTNRSDVLLSDRVPRAMFLN